MQAHHLDDPPLHRDQIQHLVAVAAQKPQGPTAGRASAGIRRRFDTLFDAGQMIRQRPVRGGTLAADRCPDRGGHSLGLALQFLQSQFQLLDLMG